MLQRISPYTIRCFNQSAEGPIDQRYHRLDKIGQHDLLQIIKSFINEKQDNYIVLEDTKQVYKFSGVIINEEKRLIHGWLDSGTYGIRSEIIDVDTGNIDYNKTQKNADVLKHYFCIFIPQGMNEAICLFHAYGVQGIKTLFHESLLKHFKKSIDLTLQMNPLAYKAAFAEWQKATAKEIIVTKFTGTSDIADTLKRLGHTEQTLVMKAPRKLSFGTLGDLLDKNKEQHQLVEALTPFGSQIRAQVHLGSRKRTFVIGSSAENAVCEIELDEKILMEGGVPVLASIHAWCLELLTEYSERMYPGFKVNL